MTYELLTALLAFAFVSTVTPGPNNLMVLASGANFGLRRTLPHMAGITLGFGFMVFLVGAGLTQVFDLFPITYTVLKIASIAFLIYLAFKIATAAAPTNHASSPTGQPITFIQAALFQWVNPKAWAMALTANSAYAPEGFGMAGALVVALAFILVNTPSITCWTLLGTQISRLLNVPWKLRAFNICAALLLLGSLYPILFQSA
ncbi:MAG: LysE family translocator [Marinosulfonomonas sp.]|nr:LysE family translocator [Marinosulfonomonas sp.]